MKQNLGSDLKIIVVGNPSTGKTSLVNKWITGHFTTNYKATIASQFNYKIIHKNDTFYRIQIWDLAGQDQDRSVTKVFCKDTQGVFVVCEVNNETSLQDTIKWKTDIINAIESVGQALVPIMLIQNKVDLLTDPADDQERIKDFGEKNGFVASYRTSAKTGDNIDRAMNFLFEEILQCSSRNPSINSQKSKNNISLNNTDINKKRGCC